MLMYRYVCSTEIIDYAFLAFDFSCTVSCAFNVTCNDIDCAFLEFDFISNINSCPRLDYLWNCLPGKAILETPYKDKKRRENYMALNQTVVDEDVVVEGR